MRAPHQSFAEVWWLKVSIPEENSSLWIRSSIMSSANGFKRTAEVLVLFSKIINPGELEKNLFRRTYDFRELDRTLHSPYEYRIGSSEFTPLRLAGSLKARDRIIQWNLKLNPQSKKGFQFFTPSTQLLLLNRNQFESPHRDLLVSGTIEMGDRLIKLKDCPAISAHFKGLSQIKNRIWVHCNHFLDANQKPFPMNLHALTFQGRIGRLAPPLSMTSCLVQYEDRSFELHRFWDLLRARSHLGMTSWEFQFEKGPYLFKGQLNSRLRDFAGFSFEDTDGRLLYSASAHLCDMSILAYRKGKLENSLHSPGAASIESVSSEKSPYITLLN